MAKKTVKTTAKKAEKKSTVKKSAKKSTRSVSQPKSAKAKAARPMPSQPKTFGPDGSTKELLKKQRGAPPNDQDPKRRLGNYDSAGEPARRGSRTSGIGGQSIRKFGTDKPQTAKSKKQ
jgi:hypothetical protein